MNTMFDKKYLALGVTALLALGAGCTSATTTNNGTALNETLSEDTIESIEGEVDDAIDEAAVNDTAEVFDIVAVQFEFIPSTITVQKGDTVTLNLSSEDVPHGFALAAFNISETLTPGKITTVEFVADQAGTFNFTCNVACGSGHSDMSGQLIVEE